MGIKTFYEKIQARHCIDKTALIKKILFGILCIFVLNKRQFLSEACPGFFFYQERFHFL